MKVLKERQKKYFKIEYTYPFPYIENGSHIYRDTDALNVIQPVYFVVSTVKKAPESFRLEIDFQINN